LASGLLVRRKNDGARLANAAAAGMESPCFKKIRETKEPKLRCEENGRSATKASHAGIIRIGFEGISQPHNWWSTPVSITRLKHFEHEDGKSERLT
jgi:hypothetical protein